MSRHKVLCVQRSNRSNPDEKIEFIGGLNANGTRWKVSQSRAIEAIESGKWEFYVQVNGNVADVIIATNNGNKYIKTKIDDLETNNLLSLPECP